MNDLYASRGPVATMPGSIHPLPEGTMCDDHTDRLAVARVQGETDSFGCEYVMMCAECKAEHDRFLQEGHKGTCEWCKKPNLRLFETRDWEEGMAGPVYHVCGDCRNRNIDSAHEELGRGNPFIDDSWDDNPLTEFDDWDGEEESQQP